MNSTEPNGARALAIEYRATTTLKANPRNARTHSKRQVRAIAESIRQFDFANPILLDEDDIILAGHEPVYGCQATWAGEGADHLHCGHVARREARIRARRQQVGRARRLGSGDAGARAWRPLRDAAGDWPLA